MVPRNRDLAILFPFRLLRSLVDPIARYLMILYFIAFLKKCHPVVLNGPRVPLDNFPLFIYFTFTFRNIHPLLGFLTGISYNSPILLLVCMAEMCVPTKYRNSTVDYWVPLRVTGQVHFEIEHIPIGVGDNQFKCSVKWVLNVELSSYSTHPVTCNREPVT